MNRELEKEIYNREGAIDGQFTESKHIHFHVDLDKPIIKTICCNFFASKIEKNMLK